MYSVSLKRIQQYKGPFMFYLPRVRKKSGVSLVIATTKNLDLRFLSDFQVTCPQEQIKVILDVPSFRRRSCLNGSTKRPQKEYDI